MYLHLGNNKSIRRCSIIGIFDMDNATISQITRRFLSSVQKNNKLTAVTGEIPKSFILTDGGNVYMSQISPSALKGRATPEE
jgi:extracellular matrix regulatory protein B